MNTEFDRTPLLNEVSFSFVYLILYPMVFRQLKHPIMYKVVYDNT